MLKNQRHFNVTNVTNVARLIAAYVHITSVLRGIVTLLMFLFNMPFCRLHIVALSVNEGSLDGSVARCKFRL